MKNGSSSGWLSLLPGLLSRAEAKTLQTTESGPGQLRQAGGRARSSQNLAKTAELARQDGGDHLKCRRYWDTESEKLNLTLYCTTWKNSIAKICYKIYFHEGTERLWISSNTTNMSSNSANLNWFIARRVWRNRLKQARGVVFSLASLSDSISLSSSPFLRANYRSSCRPPGFCKLAKSLAKYPFCPGNSELVVLPHKYLHWAPWQRA